jgi:hypothetical protein
VASFPVAQPLVLRSTEQPEHRKLRRLERVQEVGPAAHHERGNRESGKEVDRIRLRQERPGRQPDAEENGRLQAVLADGEHGSIAADPHAETVGIHVLGLTR